MVIALEIPARDHPVSTDIGCKYTASENIAPIPTHVISAPAPTITQRYDKPTLKSSLFQGSNCAAKPAAFPKDERQPAKDTQPQAFFGRASASAIAGRRNCSRSNDQPVSRAGHL
jgi:hypothetical protein